MNIHELNKQVNAVRGLHPGQLDLLIAERRVVLTNVHFTKEQALGAFGITALKHDWCGRERITFAGSVISEVPLQDADRRRIEPAWKTIYALLEERGWNETEKGMLEGVLDPRTPDPTAN